MALGRLKTLWAFVYDINMRLAAHDAWAMASHVTLAVLLALFPFLIVVASIASLVGTPELAEGIVGLAFEGWPKELSAPLASEITRVLTGRRLDLLTIGVVLLLWTSSSAVEAMRVALVRAYGVPDTRWWYWNRLQSLAFMLLGAAGMLLLSVAVVLWTPIWDFVTGYVPDLKAATWSASAFRYTATGLFLAGGLILAHIWLPPQHLPVAATLPGTLLTLALWLTTAAGFGWWLSHFANYASTYAGLGGIMAVIFFLYINSLAFIFGGELNAGLAIRRRKRQEADQDEVRKDEAGRKGAAGKKTGTA